jgi:methionyl-tRNA synthetase
MGLAPRTILITAALPYANGDIHLGHLVEHVQTDIWARFQRLRGHEVTFLCGDDGHGTPVMLRARKEGLTPEAFIAKMNQRHQEDLAQFGISFDNYYTTHSPENKALTYRIYERLQAGGHIVQRAVEQFFDPTENVFLPDRFIRGECPKCGTADQYGDSCENCGAHYEPTDLKNPRSAISGATPVLRSSQHFFMQLENFRTMLQEAYAAGLVDNNVRNKLNEWFSGPLKDWDISRDAPFFGFPIPGVENKYFYNWLDAPIGYIASLANKLGGDVDAAERFWSDPDTEIVHFIGKDIMYFHALFWPATLEGAGFQRPKHLFIHGYLTVDGAKMSKSRGTFINASTYAKHMDPQWLRYYYATKLGPTIDDMDLSLTDFTNRVNSELVGKLANLVSRAAALLSKNFAGQLSPVANDAVALLEEIRAAEADLANLYEGRDYAALTRKICLMADRVNKYFEDQTPWKLVKTDPAAAQGVLSAALEASRLFTLYLKPIMPQYAAKVEACLGIAPLEWRDAHESMPPHAIGTFTRLVDRIETEKVTAMIEETKAAAAAEATPTPTPTTQNTAPVTAPVAAPVVTAPVISADTPALPPGIDPIAPTCSFDQFLAVDLRIGKVVTAEAIASSDKIMNITMDVGPLGQRTILAGIKNAYTPERLVGRLVVFCINLAPRKMKFGTSEGMILAAGPGGSEVFVLSPDSGAQPGQRVH